MVYEPSFSVIIPTYNEEKDIDVTINNLLKLNYSNYEIIIIDDSTDRTPEIVRKYAKKNVKLIIPEIRKGRCEARNIGIKDAAGEILIILNADVHLPKNFIQNILPYYENGADYVMVNSSVENTEDLFARYVDANHKYKVNETNWVKTWKWTEGFSIRKEVALKTKLFPSGYCVPIVAGEDARFGDELEQIGANKIIDRNLFVSHIAPSKFSEYWSIRKGRGAGTPQVRRFLDKWNFFEIKRSEYFKIVKSLILIITIFPMLYINFKYAKYSNKNRFLDTFRFSFAWIIEKIAFSVGAFQSLYKIMEKEKNEDINCCV